MYNMEQGFHSEVEQTKKQRWRKGKYQAPSINAYFNLPKRNINFKIVSQTFGVISKIIFTIKKIEMKHTISINTPF